MTPQQISNFWNDILKSNHPQVNKKTPSSSFLPSSSLQASQDQDDPNDNHDIPKPQQPSAPLPLVHFFNNAGASPSPPPVLNAILSHLARETVLGGYRAAEIILSQSEHLDDHHHVHDVYHAVQTLIGAKNRDEIALVESATVGWTRIFYSMMDAWVQRDQQIFNSFGDDQCGDCDCDDDDSKDGDDDYDYEDDYEDNDCEHDDGTKENPKCRHNEIRKQYRHGNRHRFILISEAEYAANVVAILKWCSDTNRNNKNNNNNRHRPTKWLVVPIPSTKCTHPNRKGQKESSGCVDLKVFDHMLSGRWWTFPCPNDEDVLCRGGCVLNRRQDNHNYNRSDTIWLNPNAIAMVCITHIPTNSGIINPVCDVGQRIDSFNNRAAKQKYKQQKQHQKQLLPLPSILYLVDACQSVGQIQICVDDIRAHALTASGRKYLRGPRGTGFLYVTDQISSLLSPHHIDHAAAPVVISSYSSHGNDSSDGGNCHYSHNHCDSRDRPDDDDDDEANHVLDNYSHLNHYHNNENNNNNTIQFTYRKGAKRFEFWESNVSTRMGLGAAISYALNYEHNNKNNNNDDDGDDDNGMERRSGMAYIELRIRALGKELRRRLEQLDRVWLHHNNDCCHFFTNENEDENLNGNGIDRSNHNDNNESGSVSDNGEKLRYRLWKKAQNAELCGIVTFHVDGLSPQLIKEMMFTPLSSSSPSSSSLSSRKKLLNADHDDINTHQNRERGTNQNRERGGGEDLFELSVVPRTSTPIDSTVTSVGDLVRVSLSYFNTIDEIDVFCRKLQLVMELYTKVDKNMQSRHILK